MYSLFFTNLIVSNAIIILTQTRAAIAIYLLLSIFILSPLFSGEPEYKKVKHGCGTSADFSGTSYEFFI